MQKKYYTKALNQLYDTFLKIICASLYVRIYKLDIGSFIFEN